MEHGSVAVCPATTVMLVNNSWNSGSRPSSVQKHTHNFMNSTVIKCCQHGLNKSHSVLDISIIIKNIILSINLSAEYDI